MASDPQQAYQELISRVDDFYARVVGRYPEMLRCDRGCDDCCQRDLSLFPIEINRLIEAVRALSSDRQERVLTRAREALADEERACPLLEEGLCLVYPARPVLCRSHGLPLLIPNQSSLSLCPHNFQGVINIQGNCVLDLDPVNRILATANLLRARSLNSSPERVQLSRALVEALGGGPTR